MSEQQQKWNGRVLVAAVMLGVISWSLATDKSSDAPLLRAPSPVESRQAGVGSYLPDLALSSLEGKPVSWRAGKGDKVTVIALTSVTCPLCQKFAPSLAAIQKKFAGAGVKFVFVNVSGTDTPEEMRKHARGAGFDGLYLIDREHRFTTRTNAKTTTEVFVLDRASTLVYRGAISDQYGIGFSHDAPRRRYLEDAIVATLDGKAPAIAATHAPGCEIERPARPATPAADEPVTYTRTIARIMQNNCIECHRSGGVAPFALDTFDAVSWRASTIRAVTHNGIMPPWFAVESDTRTVGTASPWANDRSLTREELSAIDGWIKAGKPKGDDADLPLAASFADSEWTIGKPDAVFQIPNPIAIKADGVMPYQNVIVPTNLEEDKWVSRMQIVPSDKSVVHHVLVFVLPEEALRDRELRARAAIDESRGFFAAYVPGNDAVEYPDGLAKRLPAKSVLMFQIHYTPNGKATSDQMKIGFAFNASPPKHIVRTTGIANLRIQIPAGAENHEERASVRVPSDLRLIAFLPHMHVRGKAYRYELEAPAANGTGGSSRRMLLDIPRYDFNWQLRYILREPLDVPAGSTIHATAWYDNSANNPANPDPTKLVRWGPQTYDEMMLGYIEYYLVNDDPNHPDELPPGRLPQRPGARANRALMFEQLLKQFDLNDDGRIEKSEVPPRLHAQFDRLDRNRDGVLTDDDFGA